MPLNLIHNTAHPYFTPRVTEGDLPQGPSSSLSVNQMSNSHQQPHSLNVLKQEFQDPRINSSEKTAQSGFVCVFKEIKDAADNCIGILAERKYETAALSLGVSQCVPEGLIVHLSNTMISNTPKTQQGIEPLKRLFQNKKSQHVQQSNPPHFSPSNNLKTKKLLNSLSLASPTKYNVIPLKTVLTNEQRNKINQQVQIYVALNNSKASYEVFYENPTHVAQGKVKINSVICDYTPIILKNNDTLKARWDIISGFVDMLKQAENEKNIFGHDLAKYEYLTLDMLEKNDDTHHLKISLPAHIEQTLINKNEQGDFLELMYKHNHSLNYISPEVLVGRSSRSTSLCYSASVIIAKVLGFKFNVDCGNIPLANKFSEIFGRTQNGYSNSRPSLGDALKIFTALNSDMKHEIECEARGEHTDFFAFLDFETVS